MNLLFWPGMNKSANTLRYFLDYLRETHDVCIFPFDYDSGNMPFSKDSEWYKWLNLHNKNFSWWCGLSLGASLAFVMASFCPPERLTMINPFSSRKILSQEKKFNISNQWDFSPVCYYLEVRSAEAVLSVHDEKYLYGMV